MRFRTFLLTSTLCLAAACATVVRATPITGDISISGSVQLNNTRLELATKALPATGFVTAASGTFAGTEWSPVAYSGFQWNPVNTPILNLWSFTSGGNVFSFSLDSISIEKQTSVDLILSGSGILRATGHDDATGLWRFSINNAGGRPHTNFRFGFTSSDTAVHVPDDGSIVVLLTLAMGALSLAAYPRLARRS